MDALKRELEKSLQCYKECCTKVHDTVDENDANQLQIKTRDALIDELNKVKADLEMTLEYNESYYQ
jgi:hypothetical protein